MKKRLIAAVGLLAAMSLASCGGKKNTSSNTGDDSKLSVEDTGYLTTNFSPVEAKKYENTRAYRKVSNADELIAAIEDTINTYTTTLDKVTETASLIVRKNCEKNTTNWESALTKGLYVKNGDDFVKLPLDTPYPGNEYYQAHKVDQTTYYEDSNYTDCTFTQALTEGATVKVIEITDDIDLGYKKLNGTSMLKSYVHDLVADTKFTNSAWVEEYGVSQIEIQRANNLLIYSKNGSTIKHGGFKLNSCNNVSIRNIAFDELWQWEDSSLSTTEKVGDYDAQKWAYFKINTCDNIWIDHCTFGKAYDGIIDIANQAYSSIGLLAKTPYGAEAGTCDVQFSYCDFTGGVDDKEGYIYKMMQDIEADYQAHKNDGQCKYKYYAALRNGDISFDDIYYGMALPHKKAFLIGDEGTEYYINLNSRLSIGNCKLSNTEDRLPKIRGAEVYMYNTIIDSSKYYEARTHLYNGTTSIVKPLVQAVNSTWKAAMTSQGFVVGNGGSLYAKNVLVTGVNTLLYNNDSLYTNLSNKVTPTYNGTYKFDNVKYRKSDKDQFGTDYTNGSPSMLTTNNFVWRTSDGKAPFEIDTINLDTLEAKLSGVGVSKNFVA